MARVVYGLKMVAKYGITDRWLARVVYGVQMVEENGMLTDKLVR